MYMDLDKLFGKSPIMSAVPPFPEDLQSEIEDFSKRYISLMDKLVKHIESSPVQRTGNRVTITDDKGRMISLSSEAVLLDVKVSPLEGGYASLIVNRNVSGPDRALLLEFDTVQRAKFVHNFLRDNFRFSY